MKRRPHRHFSLLLILTMLWSMTPRQLLPVSAAEPTTPPSAVLVVGSTTLGSGDVAIKQRLESLGYTVIIRDQYLAQPKDAAHASLVLISSTITSSAVNTRFRDAGVPVMLWEASLFDDMGMTKTSLGTDYGVTGATTSVPVATPGHALAAGLTQSVAVVSTSTALSFGKPLPSAITVTLHPTEPARAPIFAYEKQAPLVGLLAPARRVGFFFGDATPTTTTAAGWQLFDAAVAWLAADANTVPAPPAPVIPEPLIGEVIARINAGATSAATIGGQSWSADSFFVGGNQWTTPSTADISGTDLDLLYRSKHSSTTDLGSFAYAIPVPAADMYAVRLHFAEIYWGAPQGMVGGIGSRIFSVNIEGGAPEIVNYDINADVGPMAAVVRTYTLPITDGTLTLDFSAIADRPTIGGIEVIRLTGQGNLTLAIDTPATTTPAAAAPATVVLTNTGTQPLLPTQVVVTNTAGLSVSVAIPALAPAEVLTHTIQWQAPAIATRAENESNAAYLQRLQAADTTDITFLARVAWQDSLGHYGVGMAAATTTQVLPILERTLSSPATASTGTTLTSTLTITNQGHATSTQGLIALQLPDGSIQHQPVPNLAPAATITLAMSWTVPAIVRTTTEEEAAYHQRLLAVGSAPVTVTARLTWQDQGAHAYGTLEDQASLMVDSLPVVTLALTGPLVVKAGETYSYTLRWTNIGRVAALDIATTLVLPDYAPLILPAIGQLAPQQIVDATIPITISTENVTTTGRLHGRAFWSTSDQVVLGPSEAVLALQITDIPTTTTIVELPDNQPPVVNAGPDQLVSLPACAQLHGTVSDDGFPAQIPLSHTWSLISGPGPVTFGDLRALQTQACFPTHGSYTLRLTADDFLATASDDMVVTVNGAPIIVSAPITSYQVLSANPEATTINATVRDFQASHPDFEDWISGWVTGLVSPTIGPDRKPRFVAANGAGGITSAETFNQWFNDVPGINQTTTVPLLLQETQPGSGVYAYHSDNFFPINNQLYGNEGNWANYHFTLELHTTFTYHGGEVFSFVGDDDIWVYINGQLVVDLGGVHSPASGAVQLDSLGLTVGNVYTFDFFFAERHLFGSNFHLETTIEFDSNQPYHYPVSAVDPEQDPLTYHLITGPTGMAIDATTGLVVWPPAFITPGAHPVTLEVRDGIGGVTQQSFILMVLPPTDNQAPMVSVQGPPTARYTETIQVTGQVVDDGRPANQPLSVHWDVVQGPGSVAFSAPASLTSQVTFTRPGMYVLRLTAFDSARIGRAQLLIEVTGPPFVPPLPAPPEETEPGLEELVVPGWIGGPGLGTTILQPTPITLTAGITVTTATVEIWPANNPAQPQTLSTTGVVTGGGTLAWIDPTILENGDYVIRVVGTTPAGEEQASGVLVTVAGEYKPGRIRFTVTDLTVPLGGMPVALGRTYDSLRRNESGDFGYGWELSVQMNLEVSPAHNVTLTLPNGRRTTFTFAPRSFGGLFGKLLSPAYTPEAGVYGSLTANGCPMMVRTNGGYLCFLDDPQYAPTHYTYTAPDGQAYTIGADGRLKSIHDLSGNSLTITRDGIVSSNGALAIPFMRDPQGRIEAIIDPMGVQYTYDYDDAGDLISARVAALGVTTAYAYDQRHLLTTTHDARGNAVATMVYDADMRLTSETNAVGQRITYRYDLGQRTTTVENPDGGHVVLAYDDYGSRIRETDPLSQTTRFVYDTAHQLVSQTNPLSLATYHTYNATGQRILTVTPLGTRQEWTYTSYGAPTAIIDAAGQQQTLTYGDDLAPATLADSRGIVGRFAWNRQGSLLRYTDANNHATVYVYDDFGNRISQTDALSQTLASAYDYSGRLLRTTDARGATTQYRYDALGRLQAVTDPFGRLTTYQYDANGNQIRHTDQQGRTTNSTYDALNRVTHVIDPVGTSSTTTYDWRNKRLTSVQGSDPTIRFTYDRAGRLTSRVSADGTPAASTTQFAYDAAGRRVSETDPLGHTTHYEYDHADRLTRVIDPLNRITSYTYDDADQVVATIDPAGRTTRYEYDTRGNQIRVIYADDTSVQRSYDGVGNLVRALDQAGHASVYTYDPINQLLSVTTALSHTTAYRYDAAGNRTAVHDANGHETLFSYDAAQRLIDKTWPDGSIERYSYDALGNQTSHQLADGQINRFSYDALNRQVEAHYFDGQVVRSTYMDCGCGESKPHTITDVHGTTTYAYDPHLRLADVSGPDGQQIAYTYDAAGQRQTMTTAGGTTSYSYDGAGQLTSITSPHGDTTAVRYTLTGQVEGETLPNGIVMAYGYDLLDRITLIEYRNADQSLVRRFDYTLDDVGNRTRLDELNGRVTEWTYDAANRLIEEQVGSPEITTPSNTGYTYDAVGNRLSQSINGVGYDFTYNVLDQLISQGTTTYQYDLRGNLTEEHTGTDVTRYHYDARDRLVSIALPGSPLISYDYDADGRRIGEHTGADHTIYVWDQESLHGDVAVELAGDGEVQTQYTWAATRLISQDRSGALSYYLHDAQLNTRALVNAGGQITDSYRYAAFGAVQGEGSTPNAYLYGSQQFDSDSQMYQMRSRYYLPGIGRFLTRDTASLDPVDPAELNRYAYVRANPISYYDPTGYMAMASQATLQKTIALPSAAMLLEAGKWVGATALVIGIVYAISGKEAVKVLEDLGCVLLRISGSHHIIQCGNCVTSVPVHKNLDIPKGTLGSIKRALQPCIPDIGKHLK